MTATHTHETTLADLAASRPASMAVMERLGLDYCCGGGRTVASACAERGLTLDALMADVRREEARPAADPERDWRHATMTELADHIESKHHAFVRDAIGRVEELMPRVVSAHGDRHPELHRLGEVVRTFIAEMRDHMIREERVLFPWLRRLERSTEIHKGPPWSVKRPISCMDHDHDNAASALAEMRSLTQGFAPPEGACASYRSLLTTLSELERDTHIHIHKENNILFPAGVRAEEALQHRGGVP